MKYDSVEMVYYKELLFYAVEIFKYLKIIKIKKSKSKVIKLISNKIIEPMKI